MSHPIQQIPQEGSVPSCCDFFAAPAYRRTLRWAEKHLYDPEEIEVFGNLPTEPGRAGADRMKEVLSQEIGKRTCTDGKPMPFDLCSLSVLIARQEKISAAVTIQPLFASSDAAEEGALVYDFGDLTNVDVVTALYVPAEFAGEIRFHWSPPWAPRPPTTFAKSRPSNDHSGEVERAQISSKALKEEEEEEAVLPLGFAPFRRQEEFWAGEQRYVRWICAHPFFPLWALDSSYAKAVVKRDGGLPPLEREEGKAVLYAETATLNLSVRQSGREKVVRNSCFFLDGRWNEPIRFYQPIN